MFLASIATEHASDGVSFLHCFLFHAWEKMAETACVPSWDLSWNSHMSCGINLIICLLVLVAATRVLV